jgi:hypothetical protein
MQTDPYYPASASDKALSVNFPGLDFPRLMTTRCARHSIGAASGSTSGIATRVCPIAQAAVVDIVIRHRGGSGRGLLSRLVPLAQVGVAAAGALMAPVRGRGWRTGRPRERGLS